MLHSNLIQATGLYNRGLKTADFHVLRETMMTAVLVVCGFMDHMEEAKLLLNGDYRIKVAEALAKGICEYFGVPYITATPIMGEPVCSAEQMDLYVQQVNPKAPKLAGLFLQIGKRYGVRGDLAFAQSIHETGFFRFGGDVKPEQNNFAGLGATGGGVPGYTFATPEEGITAQIQHLFAYASKEPLPSGETLADPRFHLVTRGTAPNIEDLAGKWAVPGYDRNKYPSQQDAFLAGDTYGQSIAKITLEISKVEAPQSPFFDVPVTHWAFPYIEEAVRLELLKGYDNGKFRPDQSASRAELAAAVVRLYHLLSGKC